MMRTRSNERRQPREYRGKWTRLAGRNRSGCLKTTFTGAGASRVSFARRDDALRNRRPEIRIHVAHGGRSLPIDLLLYLPKSRTKPAPVFLGLNFGGNHSVCDDPGITLSTAWMRDRKGAGVVDHRATEESRGSSASQWQVPKLLARGYGLATIYYGDIDPDYDDGFRRGPSVLCCGQTKPPRTRFDRGLGLGLEPRDGLPGDGRRRRRQRVAVMGHSRLGDGPLGGRQDEQFALVISATPGAAGPPSRREFGETVERSTRATLVRGHFKRYNDRVNGCR